MLYITERERGYLIASLENKFFRHLSETRIIKHRKKQQQSCKEGVFS